MFCCLNSYQYVLPSKFLSWNNSVDVGNSYWLVDNSVDVANSYWFVTPHGNADVALPLHTRLSPQFSSGHASNKETFFPG